MPSRICHARENKPGKENRRGGGLAGTEGRPWCRPGNLGIHSSPVTKILRLLLNRSQSGYRLIHLIFVALEGVPTPQADEIAAWSGKMATAMAEAGEAPVKETRLSVMRPGRRPAAARHRCGDDRAATARAARASRPE